MTSPEAIEVASTDGVTVVAHDHGGDGPAVLLSHATGFHGRYWDPIVARLPVGYRYVAVDLRGHGDSRVPHGVGMAWVGMAQDILAVADTLDIDSAGAVGHSMGGCALMLAQSMRPTLLRAAYLCEPIIFPPEFFHRDGDSMMVQIALKRREVFDSIDDVLERYGSRPPFSAVHPDALEAYVRYGFRDQDDGTVILKCRRETEAAVFRSSPTDTFTRLSDIGIPVTVAGSGDGQPPAAVSPAIADGFPNGTFLFYEDLTHFAPLEDPDRVAADIVAALDLT